MGDESRLNHRKESMGEQRSKKISEESALAEAEKALNALKEKKVEAQNKSTNVPKEKLESQKSVKIEGKESTKKSQKSPKKLKIRSKNYQNARKLVDRIKLYNISDALDLAKKTSYVKFNASIELHIKLNYEKNKPTNLRGLLQLPHSTGKVPKLGVISDELIEKISHEKKTDFDILITKPEFMPKIARLARILGPQGKMPNPKTGTVSANPQKTIEEIKKGRVEYKTDNGGIIHMIIGKVKDDNNNLLDNFRAIISAVPTSKLQSITVCATMGPGIKVSI